jgi:hypothetical protein
MYVCIFLIIRSHRSSLKSTKDTGKYSYPIYTAYSHVDCNDMNKLDIIIITPLMPEITSVTEDLQYGDVAGMLNPGMRRSSISGYSL